ncbi:MAG: hypothetical protein V4510_00720 [bacterium]
MIHKPLHFLGLVALAAGLLVPAGADGLSRDVSRTIYETGAHAQTTGIGWFQNVPHLVCVIEVFGVPGEAGAAYYSNLRIYPNVGATQAIPPTVPPVPLACPAAINPACNNPGPVDPCAIQVGGIRADEGLFIAQRAWHCHLDAVDNCYAVLGTAKWLLSTCPWNNAAWAFAVQNKGTFRGTPQDGVLMSASMTCGAPAAAEADYDVTAFIDTYGDGFSGSYNNHVPLGAIVAPGIGDYYVYSCYQVDKFIVTGAPLPVSHTDAAAMTKSHDWALILDPAAPPLVHTLSIVTHVGVTLNLQGVYDLSGQNGCQAQANAPIVLTP